MWREARKRSSLVLFEPVVDIHPKTVMFFFSLMGLKQTKSLIPPPPTPWAIYPLCS